MNAYEFLAQFPEIADRVRRELERAEGTLRDTGYMCPVVWLLGSRVHAEALPPSMSVAELRAHIRAIAQPGDKLILIYLTQSEVDGGPMIRIVFDVPDVETVALHLPLADGAQLTGPVACESWLPSKEGGLN